MWTNFAFFFLGGGNLVRGQNKSKWVCRWGVMEMARRLFAMRLNEMVNLSSRRSCGLWPFVRLWCFHEQIHFNNRKRKKNSKEPASVYVSWSGLCLKFSNFSIYMFYNHFREPPIICIEQKKEKKRQDEIGTFFPRMTAPGSPWITIYFVPPRNKPVGARCPGSSKSFIIPETSSALSCEIGKKNALSIVNIAKLIGLNLYRCGKKINK